jgi:hypothetical protein
MDGGQPPQLLTPEAAEHDVTFSPVRKTPLFAPFIVLYKNEHFTKTGSGQT